jgi:hypothetical protein
LAVVLRFSRSSNFDLIFTIKERERDRGRETDRERQRERQERKIG